MTLPMGFLTAWRIAIIVVCSFIIGIDFVRLLKHTRGSKGFTDRLRRAIVLHTLGDTLLAATTMAAYIQREVNRSPFFWPIIPMTLVLILWLYGKQGLLRDEDAVLKEWDRRYK